METYPVCTLAITNGPDFLLIGRACRVCRIWFDRDQSEDSRVVPIVPDTAYTTGMTNRQTGSKDNNTDSPLVIARLALDGLVVKVVGLGTVQIHKVTGDMHCKGVSYFNCSKIHLSKRLRQIHTVTF